MREIILIRHAEAAFARDGVPDGERPLNAIGKKHAREMAAELQKRNVVVDCFIHSGARRTRETLDLINVDDRPAHVAEKLYEGTDTDYFEAIFNCDDACKTIAIVGHNPGITHFIDDVLDRKPFFDMPPTGICAIRVYADSWQDFVKARKELSFFVHPD